MPTALRSQSTKPRSGSCGPISSSCTGGGKRKFGLVLRGARGGAEVSLNVSTSDEVSFGG